MENLCLRIARELTNLRENKCEFRGIFERRRRIKMNGVIWWGTEESLRGRLRGWKRQFLEEFRWIMRLVMWQVRFFRVGFEVEH
jgi:hypothetical protein